CRSEVASDTTERVDEVDPQSMSDQQTGAQKELFLMSVSSRFQLCTYEVGGFRAVGLAVGDEPQSVIDVQRSFAFLHAAGERDRFVVWPGSLDMLQVLANWDFFLER